MQVEDAVEEAKSPKASLSAFRLQALSGDNGADSAAPSVTDEGDKEDPSVLDAIGEIASGRVADGTVKMEVCYPCLLACMHQTPMNDILVLVAACQGRCCAQEKRAFVRTAMHLQRRRM